MNTIVLIAMFHCFSMKCPNPAPNPLIPPRGGEGNSSATGGPHTDVLDRTF